ncbi:Flagellin [Jannaschia rubra]|uniref:Flagellin n=2 Tax=Jannaschia rubra TaxID=282197 RepID=A0A0M6XSQ4_9RHOB|nr:Flagellin [Jannaschia rubra]SFF97347.1 flagellin [Jannaschia rubra]
MPAKRAHSKEYTMSSILTNNGAMVALQTLKSVNKGLGQTQNEISTGKSVASAKDNSAIWAISKQMDSDVKGFKAISESLSLGQSTVTVARNAAETITDLLTNIKGKIVAAQEANVDRGKIQTDIAALTKQIESVVGAAQFNGLNLLDGTSTEAVDVLSSLDRNASGVKASSISVERQNLSLDATATTATFGPTAANDASLIQNGAAADDSVVAVASGAGQEISIESVQSGASYRIVLGDVQLKADGGGTAVGARTFEYVANTGDSAETVSRNLRSQVSAYLGASTDNGDYTVVSNGTDPSKFTINNASGVALNVNVEAATGGTPGTSATGNGLGALKAIDVSSEVGAGNALAAIDDLIETAIDAAASFGSAQGRIETQSDFVSKLSDSLKSGIGALVDADMEEASARLQALQVQQQLATQSLSIANQAPQSILSLFR